MFIPGVIQTLACLGVPSVFVGADTEGPDESLRNLLSMAELILRIARDPKFPRNKFLEAVSNAEPGTVLPSWSAETGSADLPEDFTTTVLTVERFAGGKPAGSQGILELVSPGSALSSVLEPGLQFIPYQRRRS